MKALCSQSFRLACTTTYRLYASKTYFHWVEPSVLQYTVLSMLTTWILVAAGKVSSSTCSALNFHVVLLPCGVETLGQLLATLASISLGRPVPRPMLGAA